MPISPRHARMPPQAQAPAFSSAGGGPSWWEVSNLKSLSAARNALSSLPADLARLEHLTALSLPSNRLTALPAAAAALPELRSLDVANCALAALPEGPYPRLARLRCGANRLAALPESLGARFCAQLVQSALLLCFPAIFSGAHHATGPFFS